MYAKDFRELAREALRGRWWNAVLAGLIAGLLGGNIASGGFSGNGSSSGNTANEAGLSLDLNGVDAAVAADAPGVLPILLMVLGILLVVYAIIYIVIGGAVSFGYAKYNLDLIDGKPVQVKFLFSQFDRIGDGLVLRLLTVLYIFLWSLLLFIPGIIATYSYAMAPYILYENPGMRPSEAIRASKEMMKGRKWQLFCLLISFIGWAFLSVLTLGLGSLFLRPYMEAAGAAFYRQIQAEIHSKKNSVYGEYSVSY